MARSRDRVVPGYPTARAAGTPDPLEATNRALADQGRAMAAGSIYFIGPARARLLAAGHASI